jgi:hypothetical protein
MRLPWRKEVKVIFEPDEVEEVVQLGAFGQHPMLDLFRWNQRLAKNQLHMCLAYQDLNRAFNRLFYAFWVVMLVNTLYWVFGTPGAMETWRRCFGG